MIQSRYFVPGILGVLFLYRVVLLAMFGPVLQPDSYGYISLADAWLGDLSWMHHLDLTSGIKPATSFRMMGYPALLALMKSLFGGHFLYATILLQSAVSMGAAFMVYRVGRALELPKIWACAAMVFYSVSICVLFDLNILTDSLSASLFVISIGIIAGAMLQDEDFCFRKILLGGGLIMLAFLCRENMFYFLILATPGILVWGYIVQAGWEKTIIAAMIFMAPLLVVQEGYKSWNSYRSGERFLTTGSVAAMVIGPLRVRDAGVEIFKDHPVYEAAYQSIQNAPRDTPVIMGYDFAKYVMQAKNLNAAQMARESFSVFYLTLVKAPFDLVKNRLGRYKVRNLFLWINVDWPIEFIMEVTQQIRIPGPSETAKNLFHDFRFDQFLRVILFLMTAIPSAILYAVFMIGVPMKILGYIKRWETPPPEFLVQAWFYALFCGVTCMFILVSFEERYTIAILPWGILTSLTMMARWRKKR